MSDIQITQSLVALLLQTSTLFRSVIAYEKTVQQFTEALTREFFDYCIVSVLPGLSEIPECTIIGTSQRVALRNIQVIKQSSIIPADARCVYFNTPVENDTTFHAEAKKIFPILASFPESVIFRSVISVPIIVRHAPYGQIICINQQTASGYDESLYMAVQQMGNTISQAITYSILSTEQNRLTQEHKQFISLVSHELKTPLTSLTMYAYILEQKVQSLQDNPSIEHVQKIQTQIKKLSQLVSKLLQSE